MGKKERGLGEEGRVGYFLFLPAARLKVGGTSCSTAVLGCYFPSDSVNKCLPFPPIRHVQIVGSLATVPAW